MHRLSAFLVALTIALFLSPTAEAGKRVLVLETMSVPVVTEHERYFAEELEHLASEQDIPLELELLAGEGDSTRLKSLLDKAIAKNQPDLVAAFATLATKVAYSTLQGMEIPMIFCLVSDPVGAGVIEEVGVPSETFLTGRVFAIPRLTQMEFAIELARQVVTDRPPRFGIVHPDYPSSKGDVRMLQEAAKTAGAEIVAYEFPYEHMPEGLESMLDNAAKGIAELEDKVDFWWEVSGPLGEIDDLTRLTLEKSVKPIIFGNRQNSVELGALLSTSINAQEGGYECAELAMSVLLGSDPGSLPVLPPRSFDLGLNLKTAIDLGIVVPSTMLGLAKGNVIQ